MQNNTSTETKIKLKQAYKLAGEGLVNSVRRTYLSWKNKQNETNRVKYLKFRLALHLKMNLWPELLDLLDSELNLGLYDSTPGDLYWEIKN
ncbi:MAG: hypothetical protein R3321_00670 [Nitrososphaeraceae archaeon]|nr:hypothetical protein [Nitrososphaeraceae archaeon]